MAGRFRPVGLVAASTALLLATACGGASLGTGEDERSGPLKIGLLVPQSGTYKSLGDDMKQGFELYVAQHGGRLGGREVEIVVADEGETADSGKAAAEKLVKQDRVLAVSGVVSSATINGVKDLFETGKVPLVGSNASPTTLTGTKYIWRTSYVNDEPGKALGKHVAERAGGPVFLIAAGYQAGKDEVEGFKSTFLPAGGKPAGEEVYTPFPGTKNFQPYLAQIEKSGAKAVFCFYAGGAAVDFVKQYRDFGLAGKIPLYAPGFLTEGGVLKGQGDAANGILTALNYSADLDNAANKQFAPAYTAAHGTSPTTYAMASWDAAQVLDKAIKAAGSNGSTVTSESVNAAIAQVGDIDSPRGTWRFNSGGTPVQPWYLREVKQGANTVSSELGRLGG
ncbi:ABC transporter substrate-binding protein [Streptomyces sp. NPDC006487]|uniref:ABC transporter substrate-binding protein n=1 Tax=Streptomyces sp. NPDC006487 TaxID=3364748 RepID=UPI0036879670